MADRTSSFVLEIADEGELLRGPDSDRRHRCRLPSPQIGAVWRCSCGDVFVGMRLYECLVGGGYRYPDTLGKAVWKRMGWWWRRRHADLIAGTDAGGAA